MWAIQPKDSQNLKRSLTGWLVLSTDMILKVDTLALHGWLELTLVEIDPVVSKEKFFKIINAGWIPNGDNGSLSLG